MAKFRWVNTAKWDDAWHRSIGIVGRGLFDYLMTNALTTSEGVYSVSLARIAFDTGIDESELKKLLAKFEEDGRVFWFVGGSSDWVVLKNFLKNQRYNPKQWIGVGENVNRLPESVRVMILASESPAYIPFDTLSNGILRVGKGFRIETEKETETETEIKRKGKGRADTVRNGSATGRSPLVVEIKANQGQQK